MTDDEVGREVQALNRFVRNPVSFFSEQVTHKNFLLALVWDLMICRLSNLKVYSWMEPCRRHPFKPISKNPGTSTCPRESTDYPVTFINTFSRLKANQQENQPRPAGGPICKRGLRQSETSTETKQYQIVFKPMITLVSIFKKPKDRQAEDRVTGIVYKVKCKE